MPTSETFESRILACTDEVLAWNKPPGLATTGRTMEDRHCAQGWAIAHEGRTVWAIHQLDRHTSGIVLFARKKSVVGHWQRLWHQGRVKKYYLALVHGRLKSPTVTIDAPLKKSAERGRTAVAIRAEGKPAKTHVEELSSSGAYSSVMARPLTGRTHQLRVHLQSAGCPLIGERQYNSIPCGHHRRHCLHAFALICDASPPMDQIVAPFPDDLREVAERMRIDLGPLTNLYPSASYDHQAE